MSCFGACNNRIMPLSCMRNPVEPVIVQEAAATVASSRPGSRNRNVRAPHFPFTEKLRRNRTRVQHLNDNSNLVNSVISNNNHNTEQQTTSEDENAHVQNRRRFKLLRKLLCMKVERERDLTIDYVKGRDENITIQEKLEEAKFLLQCEIKKWKAEEEMAERECITNEENVKILQSNYKALAKHKAMLLQELIKYQSIIETLKTDLPDIFVNDGHYMQIPLQRIEKHRARYQARFKSRVLPELDIANIKHKPLSEKVKTKGRLNITPEPTASGKEDPSKSVATFTIEGEEPRLDDEEFDHNEAVQALWTQEPDTKKINFRGQSIIDPLLRKEYGGDDISDGWSIPRSWLKEEQPGPSRIVQRIRVKKESPDTDREKVRVLRSTSISLSSPTPTPEKGAKINENEEEHAEEQKKEPIEKAPTEARAESCSSKTTEELKKDLVGFLTNLFANQEEDLEEEYYSEAENSESEEEEGPIYIGRIEDGINTPDRPAEQNILVPELQGCLCSPSKQSEEFPIEVYNITSTDQISPISSSILDASVAAVIEANKRTLTPRTVEAIRDMLENSTRVILHSQSQQQMRKVALYDVERSLSNRSFDALTLIDYNTNMFSREEQYSSDFELESDNEESPSSSKSNCSTPKNEGMSKEHPAPSEIKANSSSSEDTITLVDINSLLSRQVGITTDESESESRPESRSSSEKTLTPVGSTTSLDDQFIAEVMASNNGAAEGDHSQRVITPNRLQSIRQTLRDSARVIPRTRSVQSIARAASSIKRSLSATSRNIFSKFRRHNSVGIMPASDVVNTS